ncbi:glycosyltransferase [Bacteroides graminisolvens]|uniref:glycosyltransferase family protein n=1 Tax=Bacteroides graminisolvens TaxID=477666 RepID=UPI0023F0647D|nr:glycosyltransferase [Bacteroides graminisolvens]
MANTIYILSALNNGFFKPLTQWMSEHSSEKVELIESQHVNNLQLRCLLGAWKTFFKTKKGDRVVCMFDFQGVLLYWICRVFITNRKIVIINVMNQARPGFVHKIMNYLFKVALSDSKHTVATVTSKKYGEWLNEKLQMCTDYVLLHDCNYWYYKYAKDPNEEERNTIFCGGNNARDWDFIIKVAKEMPNVNFVMMPGTACYNYYVDNGIPGNIKMYPNVPFDKFMEEELRATIVAMPLNTEAPAGLISIFQAGINGKFTIATKTATLEEYFVGNENALLEKDIEKWKDAITYYLNHPEIRKSSALKLKSFLEDECSTENYNTTILAAVKRF